MIDPKPSLACYFTIQPISSGLGHRERYRIKNSPRHRGANVSMDEDLYGSVGASLIEGKVDAAAKITEDALRSCKATRFASLLSSGFANTPRSVLDHVNGFLVACKNAFDVKAIYLPHNGFVFNNDRWYFDSNAYDVANDIASDYEWLCDPRPIEWESFTLTGLEKAQEDFEWYVNEEKFDDERWESIADVAELLVKVRFVQLIESALASGSLAVPVPVITTAYGFDFFCRFDPVMYGSKRTPT